ncbi:MAG: DegQ family serine endoprotease [Alphaproteobacteria bacterium]
MIGRLVAVVLAVAGAASGSAVVYAQELQIPENAAEMRLSFAPIVQRVAPAVVNVSASRVVERRVSPLFSDPFFQRFFGDLGSGRPSQRVQSSLGSGVIIDASGLVVTNNHVIANADEVRVALSDKREFDAEVILKDERTDLAVLQIKDAEGEMPFVEFSDSDSLLVGDLVLAIGDPFGVGQTVTSGIVSALARTQVGVSDYQFFIQTDAAINPGNSGGALIDMSGRLVGVPTAIYSRSGGSLGIGFAIPSNMVRVVAESAIRGETVRLPWVGADFQEVTADIAEGLGIERPRGALVSDVNPDGPAARAGLQVGDLVVTIDDIDVDGPSSINYRVATKGIGGEAAMGVIRDGREYVAVLALEAAPESVPRDEMRIRGNSPLAGALVANLSPALAEELAFRGKPQGVVIMDAATGSPASVAGFARGDVIVDVNGVRIDSTRSLVSAAAARQRVWQLTIRRNGQILRSQFRGG